jgi:hypothetical protein
MMMMMNLRYSSKVLFLTNPITPLYIVWIVGYLTTLHQLQWLLNAAWYETMIAFDELERLGEEAVEACFKLLSTIGLERMRRTWKSQVSIVGAPTEAQNEYLLNANQTRYRLCHLAQIPAFMETVGALHYSQERIWTISLATLIQFTPHAVSVWSVLILSRGC